MLSIAQQDGSIHFDTIKIDKEIAQSPTHQYEFKDQYIMKLYKPFIPNNRINPLNKYLTNITGDQFTYIGILSDSLTKETFGLNKYSQGDTYLGEWQNDLKQGTGIYHSINSIAATHEIYIGNWENGLRKGKGITFYLNTPSLPSSLSTTAFDVIIGEYKEDNLLNGISFNQTIRLDHQPERIIYAGKYNKEGKKEDTDAIIIQNDVMFCGAIVNDNISQGLMLRFIPETLDELKKYKFKIITKSEVIEYQTITKIVKCEVDPHITIKKAYHLDTFYENVENYYKTIIDLQEKYQTMKAFETNDIEESISLMKNHDYSDNDIERPHCFFKSIENIESS